jgi:hypothetical protein
MERAHVDALFFATLGIVVAFVLGLTLFHHPLFPFRWNELAWCKAWLATTVVDYYGVALPFSALVVAAEPNLAIGLAWALGVLVLGSPVACIWMARYKLRT